MTAKQPVFDVELASFVAAETERMSKLGIAGLFGPTTPSHRLKSTINALYSLNQFRVKDDPPANILGIFPSFIQANNWFNNANRPTLTGEYFIISIDPEVDARVRMVERWAPAARPPESDA